LVFFPPLNVDSNERPFKVEEIENDL